MVNNQRGVTLIEVLAVLIVSSIVMTVLFSIFNSYTKTSNNNQAQQMLQQEVNLFISSINQYQKKKDFSELAILLKNPETLNGEQYFSTVELVDKKQSETDDADRLIKKLSADNYLYQLSLINDEASLDTLITPANPYFLTDSFILNIKIINKSNPNGNHYSAAHGFHRLD
ncbi:type II secretion system protein [Rossellomorea sp. LJF3]|uniref:type II secretion system protein n=1 Tax=Rossellomorea sp. LJF3 TaxID=3126099 RepID=UPI00300CE9F6